MMMMSDDVFALFSCFHYVLPNINNVNDDDDDDEALLCQQTPIDKEAMVVFIVVVLRFGICGNKRVIVGFPNRLARKE